MLVVFRIHLQAVVEVDLVGNMTEARGNMRPCGCHRGRPCTCEMAKRQTDEDYACGGCINCQLNTKALQKKRKPVRKCIKYDDVMAERSFDRLEIAPGCSLRVRKPDWDVSQKSAFYTRMRQLRLGLGALRLQSAITIERQKTLRRKYTSDLMRAQEALQRLEDQRQSPGASMRKMTRDMTHVDSDVFDSHSKQLIPTETLLPEVRMRRESTNKIIATEERTLDIVEAYVRDVAIRKLQATGRAYMRAQRWKRLWRLFREDVEYAAAVVIQSVFRMHKCKPILQFLRDVRDQRYKQQAMEILCRFFRRIRIARRLMADKREAEALRRAQAMKVTAAGKLLVVVAKILCRMALWKWRDQLRRATGHGERRTLAAVLLIQKHWRGLRERLNYQRIRYRRLLSDPVRSLYDKFVVHGDLWRLLLDFDAAFKRYEHRERDERENATTFVAELIQDKRTYEDNVMQSWLTASALESPIVRGANSVQSAFNLDSLEHKEGFPLSQAILQSPMANDLISLSPSKSKSDIFPDDLPPQVIRLATYEGFSVADTVAVMRGLVAQGRDASDSKAVLKVLKSRAPLMQQAWKPERVFRQELRASAGIVSKPVQVRNQIVHGVKKKKKPLHQKPLPSIGQAFPAASYISNNMIDNIPGGLKGSVDRLLLVAGLKCFDPDTTENGKRGTFVFRIQASSDPWRSYLEMASPLLKIRREQLVQDAIQPHVRTLKDNRCFSPFDILRNVRGIDEMVSWGVPRPLVMSIYDIIELLHQQTVYRSDRSIKRQMHVSAQFEAYVERQKARATVAQRDEEAEQARQNEQALKAVADAIERDVLELPVTNGDTPAQDVIFKVCFLLCSGQNDDGSGETSNQHSFSDENYRVFLANIVQCQQEGSVDQVKESVRKRMEHAMRLAKEASIPLKRLGITTASDMVRLRTKLKPHLHASQVEAIEVLLDSVTPEDKGPGLSTGNRLAPDQGTRILQPLAPLSPIARRSKPTVDTLEESLRSIDIPF